MPNVSPSNPINVMIGGEGESTILPAQAIPPRGAGLTTRIARGTLWNLGGQGVTLIATFLATPFVIRFLGSEGYGVLSLINVLVGYLSFADMGMGSASTRFGSEAQARGDKQGEATVVWTALLLTSVPAILGALILAFAARPLVEQWLRVPLYLQEVTVVSLRLAALGFVGRAVAGVMNTPELVRLRMDLVALVNTSTSAGQILLVPVVLFLGGGLEGAVLIIAGAGLLAGLFHTLLGMRLLPPLRQPRISRALMKPLTRFGGAVVISSLAAIVLTNAEKLLLPRYASVQALAYYSVAFTLSFMLIQAPLAIAQSLLPAFSQLQARPDRTALHELYLRALRGHLYWVAPAVVFVCVVARPFFTVWAGPEFGRESTLPLYLLAIGLVFEVMAYVPYTLLVALGRTDLIARCHVGVLLPYLIGSVLLISWLGAPGAAIVWSLRAMTSMIVFALLARQVSGFSFCPLPDNVRSYLIAMMILILPVLLARLLSPSVMVLLATVLVSVTAYVVLLLTHVVTNEERLQILRLLLFRRGAKN